MSNMDGRSMPGNPDANDNDAVVKARDQVSPTIAWAFTLSMAAIIAVSLLYVGSPHALVTPIVPLDVEAARRGALAAGAAIRWIALLGMAADPVAAAASIMLGLYCLRDKRTLPALGWMLVGLSSSLFVVIDTTAGGVMAPLGRLPADSGFPGVKLVFDELFVAGTLCLSIGQLCLTIRPITARSEWVSWLHWALAIDGVVGLCSAYALLTGYDWSTALGASVGLAAVLFTVIGLRMIYTPKSVFF